MQMLGVPYLNEIGRNGTVGVVDKVNAVLWNAGIESRG